MSLNFVVGADGSEAGNRALELALEQARGQNARLIIVHAIEWSRYEILVQIAGETGASQIFIGRHGHSRLGALLFGSVAFAVSQTSPVPVVVVP